MLWQSAYQLRVAINVSERIILVCTRWSLELHVADVVARLDNDPPMQVCSKTTPGLAWIPSLTAYSSTYISLCSGSS
jgi:hypothetical protein